MNMFQDALYTILISLMMLLPSTSTFVVSAQALQGCVSPEQHQTQSYIFTPVSFISGEYMLYGQIYHPVQLNQTYPLIVCCEGFAGYTNAYNHIPKKLAEHGYIAFIFDQPGQGNSEGDYPIRSLYLERLNLYIRPSLVIETPKHFKQGEWIKTTKDAVTYMVNNSPVKEMIKKDRIGLIGHSLGGVTVTEAAEDERIKAVVSLSQSNPQSVERLTIPIQLQAGGLDISTSSISIQESSYKKAKPPKQLIIISRGTHIGFTTILPSHSQKPSWQKDISLGYALAWFDYFLKDDQNALDNITKTHPKLSRIIHSRYNIDGEENIL